MSEREVATLPSEEQTERFRALAAAQMPRLYGLTRRLVGDDAGDAVQDCLLKAFRGYGRLGDLAAGPASAPARAVTPSRSCAPD
jgi:DNA-directed RNA polymerase specialized sigma24 family protein